MSVPEILERLIALCDKRILEERANIEKLRDDIDLNQRGIDSALNRIVGYQADRRKAIQQLSQGDTGGSK